LLILDIFDQGHITFPKMLSPSVFLVELFSRKTIKLLYLLYIIQK
jgi:hypothetical protein